MSFVAIGMGSERWVNLQRIREMRHETRNGKVWTIIDVADGAPIEVRGDYIERIVSASAPVVPASPGWTLLRYYPCGDGTVERQDVAAWRVSKLGLLPVTADHDGVLAAALWPGRDTPEKDKFCILAPNGKVYDVSGWWDSEEGWLKEMTDPNRDVKHSEYMRKINQEAKEFREWRRQRAEANGKEAKPEGAAPSP